MNEPVKPTPTQPTVAQERKPNDQGVISVQGYLRIFDPKTNKTILEGRA